MPEINFLLAALTALVPLFLGFVWYHKNVFGKAWMNATGVTEEDGKKMNMMVVFGFTYLFGFLLSISLHMLTIHQFGILGLFQPEMGYTDPEGLIPALQSVLDMASDKFRTFRHGVVHGIIFGITVVLPVLGINALFEGKGWKYILINVGYWTVCIALMGGIICQWA